MGHIGGHTHKATHTSRLDGGVVYETCACGAVRVTRPDRPPEDWHACYLCCHLLAKK